MKSIQILPVQTNFIKHQELFYEIVKSVDVINCAHIALYQALFRCWNYNFFMNPVQFPRDQIMGIAGIRSKSVYYKVIRELEALDLIRYYPSKSIYAKSNFCISTLEKVNESIYISLWGITNHQNISKSDTQQNELFADKSQCNLRLMSNLINGKGELVLLKKYAILNDDTSPNLTDISGEKPETVIPAFNPLTDPKYASQIDNRISSPHNNFNYANHQNSQSGHSGLRPPGVQIDPDADYSIRL